MWFIRKRIAHVPEPYTYQYNWNQSTPEPWRQTVSAGSVFWAPMDVLEALSDPARLRMIQQREQEWLQELESDVRDNGIRRVLELVYDDRGRIRIKNGHHRVIVCRALGYGRLPVSLKPSRGIRGWSVPVSDVLPRLLPAAL